MFLYVNVYLYVVYIRLSIRYIVRLNRCKCKRVRRKRHEKQSKHFARDGAIAKDPKRREMMNRRAECRSRILMESMKSAKALVVWINNSCCENDVIWDEDIIRVGVRPFGTGADVR
jgi:hypothetical protein